MLGQVVLSMWGAHDDAASAIQPDVVFCMCLVEAHSVECDTDKIRVYRVERFFHIPGADAAAATSLLDFFL